MLLQQILASTTYGKIQKRLYQNNKFKILASTWNGKFKLPIGSYSVSNIQDYFEYIIKKNETLTDNPPIEIRIISKFYRLKRYNYLEALKQDNQG